MAYFDLRIHGRFFRVVLLVLVWVHADVVEGEFLLNAVFEQLPLLQGQTIRLRDDWDHIHGLAQLLQHDNINRLQRMSGRRNEVQAAMNAGILNIPLTLGCEFFAQVGGVLILDIFDDGIPAAVVVDEVAVTRGVDDVEAEAHAVLFDNVSDGVDLGGLADGLVGGEAALAVDEVGGEDGVDQRALAESGLACIMMVLSASAFRWM